MANPRIRRIAAGVETLALRQVADGLAGGGIQNPLLRKACRQPEKRVAGKDDALRLRNRTECRRAEERLEEPDLAAKRARGELAVAAEVLARRRIDLIVARVAQRRQRERRQPHVWKHPIDRI